jgi:hypothetical protein
MEIEQSDAPKHDDASQKNNKEPSLFDASIILATATAYIYFCTYSYEQGYCVHFDVPTYLIEPSFNTFLEFGAALFLTLLAMSSPVGLMLPIFTKSYKNIYLGRIIKINAVFLIITLVVLYTFPWSLKLLACIAVMLVVANLSSWGIPYIFSLRKSDPLENAYQITRENNNMNLLSLLEGRVKSEFHWLIITAIFLPLLIFFYGVGKAASKTDFQYVKGHPDLIVVRKYGNLLVCKKVIISEKKTTSTTILLNSSEPSITLINKTMKPFN